MKKGIIPLLAAVMLMTGAQVVRADTDPSWGVSTKSVNVTVPANIGIIMNEDGTNTVSDFTIVNGTELPMEIKNVTLSPKNGWSLADSGYKFTRNQKKISLSFNGNTLVSGNNKVDINVDYDKKYTVPIDVKRGAWTTTNKESAFDMGIQYDFGTRQFQITFDSGVSPIKANNGTSVTVPSAKKDHYDFLGWKNKSGKIISAGSSYVMPVGGDSFTAQWKPHEYKLTFNTNGGTLTNPPTSYNYETETFNLPTPTRNGYTFNGWYSGDTKVTSIPKGSSGDKTFTAKWTANKYSITYNLNGGTSGGSNPSSYTIESATFTLVNPTRTGYTFTGWSGTGISGVSTSVSVQKGSTGNRSYTANWDANSYTYDIVYKSESGKTLGTATVTGDFDTSKTVEAKEISGYTKPASQKVNFDSVNKKTITFTYDIIEYSISYKLNGGSVSANPSRYNVESNSITLNNPARTGYTFKGWTGSNGTTPQTSVTIGKGSTGNKTYTANWKANNYTVKFDPNGGTITGASSITKGYEEALGTLPVASKGSGYKFLGWYTAKTGGTKITESTKMPLNGATYYAHYEVIYTLTVTDDNGNKVVVVTPDTSSTGDDIKFKLPLKDGYDLAQSEITVDASEFNNGVLSKPYYYAHKLEIKIVDSVVSSNNITKVIEVGGSYTLPNTTDLGQTKRELLGYSDTQGGDVTHNLADPITYSGREANALINSNHKETITLYAKYAGKPYPVIDKEKFWNFMSDLMNKYRGLFTQNNSVILSMGGQGTHDAVYVKDVDLAEDPNYPIYGMLVYYDRISSWGVNVYSPNEETIYYPEDSSYFFSGDKIAYWESGDQLDQGSMMKIFIETDEKISGKDIINASHMFYNMPPLVSADIPTDSVNIEDASYMYSKTVFSSFNDNTLDKFPSSPTNMSHMFFDAFVNDPISTEFPELDFSNATDVSYMCSVTDEFFDHYAGYQGYGNWCEPATIITNSYKYKMPNVVNAEGLFKGYKFYGYATSSTDEISISMPNVKNVSYLAEDSDVYIPIINDGSFEGIETARGMYKNNTTKYYYYREITWHINTDCDYSEILYGSNMIDGILYLTYYDDLGLSICESIEEEHSSSTYASGSDLSIILKDKRPSSDVPDIEEPGLSDPSLDDDSQDVPDIEEPGLSDPSLDDTDQGTSEPDDTVPDVPDTPEVDAPELEIPSDDTDNSNSGADVVLPDTDESTTNDGVSDGLESVTEPGDISLFYGYNYGTNLHCVLGF